VADSTFCHSIFWRGGRMVRLASLLVMVVTMANIGYSETWITIKDRAHRLKRTTNCSVLAAKNSATECECCLIKNALVYKKGNLEAVNICTDALKCQFDQAAYKSEFGAIGALNNAKQNLKAMSIVNIEKIDNRPILPADGMLTESHVMDILQSLNMAGYVTLPDNIDQTLKIKPLGDSAKGFWSGQLFAIRYIEPTAQNPNPVTKPLYILKETKKGIREISHLYQINASPLIAEKIPTIDLMTNPIGDVSMARVSFDDVHFKLKTKGKVRYFSLLQTAPGQSLHNYLKEFGKISRSREIYDPGLQAYHLKMKHIFYRVGFAVSKLHQKYANVSDKREFTERKTFVHGDMHSENIFFDDTTDMVTLIDNETFALSLDHPSSGVNDLVEFYMVHSIHTIAQKFSDQLTINTEFGIDDRLWHEMWHSLFDGYLSAYGEISQDVYLKLYEGFRKKFFKGFSNKSIFTSPRNIKDQRKLKRIGPSSRRKHLEKVELRHTFDRLLDDGMKKYDGKA
jgi:hypothetical protein